MGAFIIVAIILVIVLYWVVNSGDKTKRQPVKKSSTPEKLQPKSEKDKLEVNITTLGEDRLAEDDYEDRSFSTYVAGLNYHVDKQKDIFVAFAVPEPTNQYDKDAVMVVSADGVLLGYIPKSDLEDFKDWSEDKPIPCVGYYEKEGDKYHSNLKCIRPYTQEYITEEIEKYLKWFKENKI